MDIGVDRVAMSTARSTSRLYHLISVRFGVLCDGVQADWRPKISVAALQPLLENSKAKLSGIACLIRELKTLRILIYYV
jgi:hypothetical protein